MSAVLLFVLIKVQCHLTLMFKVNQNKLFEITIFSQVSRAVQDFFSKNEVFNF